MDDGVTIGPWIYRVAFGLLAAFAVAAAVLIVSAPDDRPELPALAASSGGLSLVVFETESCPWCKKFRRETADEYQGSSRGRMAPLRYMHVSQQRESGYSLKSHVRTVPTFVLVGADGREVDRIAGYPGGGRTFMTAVDRMLAKVN